MNKLLFALLLLTNTSNAQINLNQGLISYYPFSGNANEVTGNGLNGILQNGPQLTTDRFGTANSAFYFDGIDDYIQIPSNASLNPTTAFSITLYFNSEQNSVQTLIGKISYLGGVGTQYQIAMNFAPFPGVLYGVNPPSNSCAGVPLNGAYVNTGAGSVANNQWYCLVATFNNGIMKIYLNGILIQTTTASFSLLNECSNADVQIGSWWQGDQQRYKGKIDDIRFYNRAINAAEVAALCNLTPPTACTNWLNTPSSPSYVNIGDLDVPGNKITVEATFNRTAPYSGGVLYAGNLVSKHNFPTTVNYLLRPNTAEITTSNGYFRTPDICDIELNKTYHAAMVYDGTSLKFYRDGFLMSQIAVTGNLVQNDLQTRIGWLDFTATAENFIGYINEVRIWNVAKTQSEIRTYINTSLPTPTTQPGLVGYYRFDNLLNKQGNATFNGILGGSASINQSNPNCEYVADSCFMSAPILNTIINSYTPVVGFNNLCKNEITVEDGSAFSIGDTVLIIQMKGAVIDSANSTSFGAITNYKNAGNYEFNYVKNKVGNIIELKNTFLKQYDLPAGKVQLIRVPYFNNVAIQNTLTCLPWDGNKGGVLVFNVKDSIIMNADINVSGKGFNGGNSANPQSNTLYCNENNYYYPGSSLLAAAKGESIYSIGNNISKGKGAPANGGGGGLGHNSGGGGGGNAGGGGLGGYQLLTCGNAPFDNRGRGGKLLTYSNVQNKIFLGGGGGSGHVDNAGGSSMKGGNGGGIVIMNASFIQSNSNKIIANGADAPQCTLSAYSDCHDASGGGGAGGAIIIKNNIYGTQLTIEAKGGKGADVIIYDPAVGADKIGPGGGGGAGIVWLSSASLPANVTTNITAGANGVISLDNKNPWGATSGTPGTVLFNASLPISTIPFTPNIDSVRIKDSATNCNSFNFKGLAFIKSFAIAQWAWSFGDGGIASTQNTTHSYTTAGNYSVKLVVIDANGCKDSIIRNVTAGFSNGDFSYKQNTCNPLSVQFFNIGNSPSNTYWSFGDGNTITGSTSPVHVYAATGNYTVKYGFQNGTCLDTVIKNISINILQSNIILTADTTLCFNTTKKLLTQPALSFCWSPTSFLNDPLSPNPITSTPGSITYYFTAEIPGINIITNGNFSAGNTGFTSAYNFAVNNTTEGQYFVGTSPQAWNAALSNCTDHTGGNGNMLLVNGSPAPDVKVWSQTVTVTPNTNYAFSSWIQALYPPNPAQLSFSINGLDVGTMITASLPTCTWSQFYTTWNSGNNTSANISIINKNTFVQGNDFALDDISFAPVLIKRDSVKISIDTPFVRTLTDTATCKGKPVQLASTGAAQYSWTPSAGLSNTSVSNPIANPADTTRYIVTGTNARGCIAKDTVMVFVKKLPVISRSANDTVCINQTVQMFATGGVTYSWLPANTLNNPAIANPIATPAATTNYTVVVTGANNCVNTDSVKITTKAMPAFTINADTATCVNGKAQLTAGGGTSYLWSPASMLNNAAIANPVATVSINTNFTVIIKDNICNLADTLFTNVSTDLALPDIVAAKSNDMDCVFNIVQLSVTGADVFVWTPATDLSSAVIANPVASPTVSRQYKVVGTNIINNCSSSDTITVFVKAPAGPKSYIPNSFTPNGDGVNDCFKVGDFGTIKTVDITIYNRYGNLVFHTKNATLCWDGKYKGQPAEIGNYVYYIKVLNDCGEEIKKGNLLLFR